MQLNVIGTVRKKLFCKCTGSQCVEVNAASITEVKHFKAIVAESVFVFMQNYMENS